MNFVFYLNLILILGSIVTGLLLAIIQGEPLITGSVLPMLTLPVVAVLQLATTGFLLIKRPQVGSTSARNLYLLVAGLAIVPFISMEFVSHPWLFPAGMLLSFIAAILHIIWINKVRQA